MLRSNRPVEEYKEVWPWMLKMALGAHVDVNTVDIPTLSYVLRLPVKKMGGNKHFSEIILLTCFRFCLQTVL